MKTIITKLSFIAALALVFTACDDAMGDTNSKLAAVKAFIEPADGKSVVLEIAAASSVYFEWEYVSQREGGTAVYQIAFDKEDGDFSSPLYILSADNNGMSNYATISHKQLNTIAGKAGIKTSEAGTIKWTVLSSKGTRVMKSEQEHKLTLTRLGGFENLPIDVYVSGEGSEGGTDLSKAHKMRATAGGEFEVYTYLTAGKPYYFTDDNSGTPRQFYTESGLVKEDGTTTIAADGVYKITLDFNIGAATYTLITRMSFYFCPDDEILFDLPYVGYGVFQTRETVTFKQEDWGRDERYKFRMFIKENGGAGEEIELQWAPVDESIDSRPTSSSPESYYYMQLQSNLTQWNPKWKLMGDFDGNPATYTIYLTTDQPYTHSITK